MEYSAPGGCLYSPDVPGEAGPWCGACVAAARSPCPPRRAAVARCRTRTTPVAFRSVFRAPRAVNPEGVPDTWTALLDEPLEYVGGVPEWHLDARWQWDELERFASGWTIEKVQSGSWRSRSRSGLPDEGPVVADQIHERPPLELKTLFARESSLDGFD